MKPTLPLFIILLALIACTKPSGENQISLNPENSNDLGELTISQNFNWSSSSKGIKQLNFIREDGVNGGEIWIVDGQGNRLDRNIIMDNKVVFDVLLPANEGPYFFYHPETGTKVQITSDSKYEFRIGKGKKSGIDSKSKTSANILVNPYFSSTTLYHASPLFHLGGAGALNHTGGWWVSTSAFPNVVNNSGYFQTTTGSTQITQVVSALPNTAYKLQVAATSLSGVPVNFIALDNAGNTVYGDYTLYDNYAPRGSGGPNQKTFTTPANTAYIQITYSLNTSTSANYIILNEMSTDSDADGVPNTTDDYPNNPAKAYRSYFPTTGYQTLAFEDLWPYKGDYDFNDLVVSTRIETSRNASNDKVDMTFTMSIDAFGAGMHQGLGVMLWTQYSSAFPSNIIESVSGDAELDPNNVNGLIVFNDIVAEQGVNSYSNNGVGPSRTPITYTFTVTFNSAYQTTYSSDPIVPDIYIFRSNDRSHEIHQFGFYGTNVSNVLQNYNIGDDKGNNGPFKTQSGLPWVLEVITANKSFRHPLEKVDILEAYPQFQAWAESEGSTNTSWLNNPDILKVF